MKHELTKNYKSLIRFCVLFLAIGLISGALIVHALTPANTLYLSSGIYPGASSYTIFQENGNVFAKNAYGQIEYSGTDAGTLVNTVRSAIGTVGGEIHFVKGDFYCNTTFQFIATGGSDPQWITISGEGPATQLYFNTAIPAIQIEGQAEFGTGGPYHFVIKDLVLTTSPAIGNMTRGIYVKNWFGLTIENVMIFYASDAAIYLEDSGAIRLRNIYTCGCGGESLEIKGCMDIYIQQYYSDTDYRGVWIDQSATYHLPWKIYFNQLKVTIPKQEGITIWQASDIVVENFNIEGTINTAIKIGDSERIHIAHGDIRSLAQGITISSSSKNMSTCNIIIDVVSIYQTYDHGIRIVSQATYPIGNIAIVNSVIQNSGFNGGYYYGVSATNTAGGWVHNVTISSCFIGNRLGQTATQRDGVHTENQCDYFHIVDNTFYNNTASPITLVGTHNTIKNNLGYVTYNSGSASIADGATVNHGLSGTPTSVILTSSEVNYYPFCTSKASTTFTVNWKYWNGTAFETATGSHALYWSAEF